LSSAANLGKALACLLLIGGTLECDGDEFSLSAGVPVNLEFPDRRELRVPPGGGTAADGSALPTRSIRLTNTGQASIRGRLLVVNGRDWSSPDGVAAFLNLGPGLGERSRALFRFWVENRLHASSGCQSARDPLLLLNFWGYGLCDETTRAFSHLMEHFGVPGRSLALNGHVAAEYFFDRAWHVLDADTGVFYLGLDNSSLAGYADLIRDPFPLLRTRVSGRSAGADIAASVFNASLYEFVQPRPSKPIQHKKPVAVLEPEELFPGESVIFDYATPPLNPTGHSDLGAWPGTREASLRTVEWVLNPASRRANGEGLVFRSGHPILYALDPVSGRQLNAPGGDPCFELALPAEFCSGKPRVFCQRSAVSFPQLRTGSNTFLLDAPEGNARLEMVLEPFRMAHPAPSARFAGGEVPVFNIDPGAGTESVWWQISEDPSFHWIIPNFDRVESDRTKVELDALSATFFREKMPYYFRVRRRVSGLWTEWSASVEFTVSLPTRPSPVKVESGRQLILSWPDAGPDAEYLVYGSQRLDFIPEHYASEEVVRMRNRKVEELRPNKNLVAVVRQPRIELDAKHPFYRVVTRVGRRHSVPSELVWTPAVYSKQVSPATVLQTRWKKVSDPNHKNGYWDEHLSSELPLSSAAMP
jgi:hypothetical protein